MNLWPRGQTAIALAEPEEDAATDLISVRISLDDRTLAWIQIVPFDPPLTEERDRQLIHDLLGARGVLLWIHNVLDDLTSDGGGAWDAEPTAPATRDRQAQANVVELPSIEQALRAWMRNPKRLEMVNHILETSALDHSTAEDDVTAQVQLKTFAQSWNVLRAELLNGTAHDR